MNLDIIESLTQDAIDQGSDVATSVANQDPGGDPGVDDNALDAMDCMFDHGYASGAALGKSDYAAGVVDVQPLSDASAEQFEHAYVQCGVDQTIERGEAFNPPSLGNPWLAALDVSLTPTAANVGEAEYLGAQRQFVEGFQEGYREGGVAEFDKGIEGILHPDASHPATEASSNDMGGRPDLAAAIDAAFAPVSNNDHVDHSAGSSDATSSGAASSSGADSAGSSGSGLD